MAASVSVDRLLEELTMGKGTTMRSLYFTQLPFGRPGQRGHMTTGSLRRDPAAKMIFWNKRGGHFLVIQNDGQGERPVLAGDAPALVRSFLIPPVEWVTMIDLGPDGTEKIKRAHVRDDVDPGAPVCLPALAMADQQRRRRLMIIVALTLTVAVGLSFWYGRTKPRALIFGRKKSKIQSQEVKHGRVAGTDF